MEWEAACNVYLSEGKERDWIRGEGKKLRKKRGKTWIEEEIYCKQTDRWRMLRKNKQINGTEKNSINDR